jgi:hypothetical protein
MDPVKHFTAYMRFMPENNSDTKAMGAVMGLVIIAV